MIYRYTCSAIIVFLFIISQAALSQISRESRDALDEKQEDQFEELSNNNLTLRFQNALNGEKISGATVEIGKSGTYTTDGQGRALFPATLDDGVYNVSFRAEGFVPCDFTIEIMAGTLFFNRFSVSPQLNIRFLRIVLDWDKTPLDIDAHFVKQGGYHISYRDMTTSADGVGTLDRDDMDGYGPETITVTEVSKDGAYSFFVHDYSDKDNPNSRELSQSKATVKIFGDGKLLNVIQIPQDGRGTIWQVFKIENGNTIIVNNVTNASGE